MADRQMTKLTYGRNTYDRKEISPKGDMAEKYEKKRAFGRNNIKPKKHRAQKIDHETIIPYDICWQKEI